MARRCSLHLPPRSVDFQLELWARAADTDRGTTAGFDQNSVRPGTGGGVQLGTPDADGRRVGLRRA